jgi:hypothetical protein
MATCSHELYGPDGSSSDLKTSAIIACMYAQDESRMNLSWKIIQTGLDLC